MPPSADLHAGARPGPAGASSLIPSYVSSAVSGTMTDVDGREWGAIVRQLDPVAGGRSRGFEIPLLNDLESEENPGRPR
jgi:hypothetical protein